MKKFTVRDRLLFIFSLLNFFTLRFLLTKRVIKADYKRLGSELPIAAATHD
jgi:hypothetical protein